MLLWLALSGLAGLGIGYSEFMLRPLSLWISVAALAIFIGRYKALGLCGVIILGLSLGCWRGATLQHRLDGYYHLYDQKVQLQVTASEDAVYGKNSQLTFVAVNVTDMLAGTKLPGKIGVNGFGENAVFQGDTLIVEGKLRSGIGSYQGFMSFALLDITAHHTSPIIDLRRRFGTGMLSALPEPLASFSMGLLIGQRASLPEDDKMHLQMVGLTHIIAVSGANLTIMLEASRKILGKRSKRLSTALSMGLMMVFVLMTGGSASIIRAAYVSAFSVAAAYYGRQMRPLLIISMVAAVTGFMNPIYVWADASWYLSFLAFFGVMMVSPLLQKRLPNAFERNIILAVALESLCAEIMSLPYILYTFGQMSFIGIVANMLVVIMIPLAMLLGLIAGLAGMFAYPLCGWFAWPAKYLLMYMLDTAHILADLPHVFIDNIWLSLPGLLGLYCVIVGMVFLLNFKDQRKSTILTDEEPTDSPRILGRMY